MTLFTSPPGRKTKSKKGKTTGGLASYPAGTPETDLMTREDAAAQLGIASRTLYVWEQKWKRQSINWGAGRVGAGSRGWYPIEAIREWATGQGLGRSQLAESPAALANKNRQLEIELLEREHDWRMKSGEFVLAADVEAFYSRVISTWRALADGIGDKVASRLPMGAVVTEAVVAHVRETVAGDIADMNAILRELTQGDQDEEEAAGENSAGVPSDEK